MIEREADKLCDEINRLLAAEVEMTSLRALAHARLERALPETVAAVGHPAVSCEHRLTDRRPTYRLCFLCSVFMMWSFGDRWVDIYCRADASSGALPHHLRFRFAPHVGEWRIMLPSRPIFTGVFTCEGEKVLEMIRDAVRGMSPRVSPLGEEPDG